LLSLGKKVFLLFDNLVECVLIKYFSLYMISAQGGLTGQACKPVRQRSKNKIIN
jgi:hypothetical protein